MSNVLPGKLIGICLMLGAIFASSAQAKIGVVDRPITDLIVLHSVGGFECKNEQWTHFPSFKTLSRAVDFFANADLVVGVHFIVAKDGQSKASTPVAKVANHVAGREQKGDKLSYNQRSIGIEMLNDGDGTDPYPEKQIEAVVSLLKILVQKYSLDKKSIRPHSALDRRVVQCAGKKYPRRTDPGPAFPLKEVIRRVFK